MSNQSSTPSASALPSFSTLEATLERITYANEETGYTVARVSVRGSGAELLTIVGNLATSMCYICWVAAS